MLTTVFLRVHLFHLHATRFILCPCTTLACGVCSHNKIDGETLLAAAVEIDGRQRRRIIKLDLTYNFIDGHVQQEIQRRYSKIAKSVAAPSLFPCVR